MKEVRTLRDRVADRGDQSARDSEWNLRSAFPFKKWLAGLALLGFIVILAATALSIRQAEDLTKSRDWIVHAYAVLTELDSLRTLTVSAETAQRGYLITGQVEYLAPYVDARDNLPKQLSQLKIITEDNVRQRAHIRTLESALGQKFQELRQTIDMRRRGHLHEAIQMVASDRGKRYMEKVLRIIDTMKAEEQRLLLGRTEAVRLNLNRFHFYLSVLSSGLAVVITVFMYLLLRNRRQVLTMLKQQQTLDAKAQEQRFQRLFDLMPQLGWTARADGYIDFYNKGWYDYTGTTFEQMQGWGWQSVHAPEHLPEVLERWRYSLKTGTPFEMEFPLRRADGVFRRFLTRVTPMFDPDGDIVRWVGINTDIDERAAELEAINAKLTDSEERLDIALRSNEMGVWDLDLKSGAVWHSLKHDQIFGYKHLQPVWTYDIFIDHLVPDDRTRAKEAFAHASTAGSINLECRILKDQSYAWILMQGKVLHNKHGQPVRIMGTVMDITERKEVEIAKERLVSIVAASADAIIGMTFDGVITSWNKGAEEMFGYQENELVGKPVSVLIPPPALDELPELLSRVALGRIVGGYETTRITKAGKVIDVYVTVSPIKDREGRIVGASEIVRDITASKRAKAELQEAKEFSESLFQLAPDAILLVDSRGLIFSVNEQAEKLFGYSGAELLGQRVESLIPARFRDRHVMHRRHYSGAAQTRPMGMGLNLYAQRKDGSEFPVDIRLSPVTTERTSLVMAVVRDLTDLKKLEAEQKKAEQAAKNQDAVLSNPSPDPVLVTVSKTGSTCAVVAVFIISLIGLVGCILQLDVLRNPTPWGTCTKANAAACLLLGCISLLLRGRPGAIPNLIRLALSGIICAVATITICEWVFGWNAGIDQLIAPDRLIREPFAPGRMSGSTAVALLFLGGGLCSLHVGRVVLSQIFSLATLSIGLLLLNGHTYGFRELTTFGTSTLTSLPISICLVLIGGALWLTEVERGLAHVIVSPSLGGKVARSLLPIVLLVPVIGLVGGGTFTPLDVLVLTSVATILFPGSVWLASRTIDQLDRQKDQALNRAFARREELEASNLRLAESRDQALQASNLKSAFVANISHELRTPLSGIIAANDLLAQHELEPEVGELIANSQESAQSLKSLVDDLLDLSKIESGKFAIEAAPFNVIDVVKDSMNLCALAAEKKELSLTAYIDPRIPALVVGDAGRIRQVLLNLINNSIKFTSFGNIRVDVEPDSETGGESAVRFAVSDTGIGISEEEQKLLFIPFSQVDSSATRQHGGAGLGLALCKNLVDMMGGTIGVKSRKGEGARFWFTLPLRALPSAQLEKTVAPLLKMNSKLRDKMVLVIEDNPVIQKLVLKQLLSLGLLAVAASTGKEALSVTASSHFDLILLDCNLPDMTGFDVTSEIRKMEAGGTAHIPIVAMTAAAMEGDREKCLSGGMDDYLSKPVSIQRLHETLEKWLTDSGTSS